MCAGPQHTRYDNISLPWTFYHFDRQPNYVYDGIDGSPDKGKNKNKHKSKPTVSDSSSYSDNQSDWGSEKSVVMDVDPSSPLMDDPMLRLGSTTNGIPPVQRNEPVDTMKCGLCAQVHGLGECFMTDKPEYLAEYREMLILHANDEPWETRVRVCTTTRQIHSVETYA